MNDELSREWLDAIQPVVLVGGKSRRFGRDKLREPIRGPGDLMVGRPIEALRAVFGRRVRLVGECSPDLLPLADGTLPDLYPGSGPLGGIASSLIAWSGPVFVLAGDLPHITPSAVRTVLVAAKGAPAAWAVIATSEARQPCIGLYRPAALATLRESLDGGRLKLSVAVPDPQLHLVSLPKEVMANVNTPDDLSPGRSAR